MELREYVTDDGRCPFSKWLNELRDAQARARIRVRLDRVAHGNLGDHRSVGKGVWELRIHHGPGYRVYFGKQGQSIVLLLCGGDKASQRKDIQKARLYWLDYLERLND